MSTEHRIALVDDHHLVRAALGSAINNLGGYRVTIEAGHGGELVEALEQGGEVDIAIVDLNMPVMDGYATLDWLRRNRPGLPVLVLTFDTTDEAMARAVRAGAGGYLMKDTRPPILRKALDSLVLTGYYITDEIQRALIGGPPEPDGGTPDQGAALERISPRELEFLRLVCDEAEYTYDQIAERMTVSRRTVDGYRASLFDKFKVRSKTGLVLLAMRNGVIG